MDRKTVRTVRSDARRKPFPAEELFHLPRAILEKTLRDKKPSIPRIRKKRKKNQERKDNLEKSRITKL